MTSSPVRYCVPSASVKRSFAVSPIRLIAVLASFTPGISMRRRFSPSMLTEASDTPMALTRLLMTCCVCSMVSFSLLPVIFPVCASMTTYTPPSISRPYFSESLILFTGPSPKNETYAPNATSAIISTLRIFLNFELILLLSHFPQYYLSGLKNLVLPCILLHFSHIFKSQLPVPQD